MTVQIPVKCISLIPKRNDFLSVYLWQLLHVILKIVGNTGGLSLILLWHFYLSMWFSDIASWKSQKDSNHKKCM